MLVEYKDVVLLRDVEKGNPAYGGVEFRCGDIGVLVDLLDGYEAAIVEFIAGPGHTLDVTPLTRADVRHLEPDEIQTLRVVDLDGYEEAPVEDMLASWSRLHQYSCLALTRPIPELGLLADDLGVVVDANPGAGPYNIRMLVGHEPDGPVITLPAEALRIPEWYELPTVRKLQPAAPAPAAAAQTAG